MKRLILMIALVALAASCAKKKVKKTIEGEWEVVSYIETIEGAASTQEISAGYHLTLTFENDLLKNDGYCPMIWKESYPSETLTSKLEYKLVARGDEMEMRNLTNEDIVVLFSVDNLTDTSFDLETLNINGAEARLQLQKI